MRLNAIFIVIIILGGCSSSDETAQNNNPDRESISYSSLTTERRLVLNESQKWLGTPYRYGGNDRAGTDCSGFVSSVYAAIGISLPRRARDMYETGTPTSLKSIAPGDLVFFNNTAGKGITHVGIYTGSAKFIHASTATGVITSSLDQAYYNKHYAGARKVLR